MISRSASEQIADPAQARLSTLIAIKAPSALGQAAAAAAAAAGAASPAAAAVAPRPPPPMQLGSIVITCTAADSELCHMIKEGKRGGKEGRRRKEGGEGSVMREGQWYFACGGGVQGGGAPLRPLANENLVPDL